MKNAMLAAVAVLVATPAWSQELPKVPPSITTPDKVETRIGTLDFKDGAPSKATLDKVYDDLDFTHAQRAFADTFQGVSLVAARRAFSTPASRTTKSSSSPS